MLNDIDIKDIIPKNVFGANSVLLYCCIRIATLLTSLDFMQLIHKPVRSKGYLNTKCNKIMFKKHGVCPMLTLTLFKIFASKYIWATTLTFQGHVTSPVTWPIDAPGAISYRRSIITKSVSPAIFKTIVPKDIGVTTWTFLGHMTWPIDPPYAISYWCPIRTESLFWTVFQIFASKYIWVTTLNFRGHVM